MALYPELTYRFPTLNNGNQADTRPQIVLDWSADMETTQFSDPDKRAKNIVLMEDVISSVVATDFISYDAGLRRITLQPSLDLKPGSIYRILVKNKLLSTDGRKSFNEYNWIFQTAPSVLDSPSLLSPADASIQTIFPTLTWATVANTGMVSYNVQIDDRWDFSSPTYVATTTSTALTPAGVFSEDTTYYWRVQAFTSSASGAWSDPRQFFYGRAIDSDPSSRQNFPDEGLFVIRGTSFKNGLSNQAAFPLLKITFSSTPASDFADYVTVVAKNVLPRNDKVATYDDVIVNGSWSLTGNTITFTPADVIKKNTKYEINLMSGMTDTTGFVMGKDFTYYWTGKYDPYYVHIREIRSRFLGAEQQIPDDLINFYIHLASLEANSRYYGYDIFGSYSMPGDMLLENIVRDSSDLQSHGVLKWVAAAATYRILKAILFENVRDIGRTEKVGDADMQLTGDFVKGMQLALEQVTEELAQWEAYLVPSDVPISVSKSSGWSTRAWDWDYNLGGHESKRDDWFDGNHGGGMYDPYRGWSDHR